MPFSYSKTARERYAIEHWSEGYFDVDDDGSLVVLPGGSEESGVFRLETLIGQASEKGLGTPLLIRFLDILEHRAKTLTHAFHDTRRDHDYSGDYKLIYPIKVNQQKSVVERLCQLAPECIGLEAGSKAELLILLGVAPAGSTIICNGFKDRQFVRLAFLGQSMGFDVHIVIESEADAALVIAVNEVMPRCPSLGLRIRLSATASGKWQNTGGELSKFGLSAGDLLRTCDQISAARLTSRVKLLHVHMGSQISHIRDLQQGMREVARYFSSLTQLGLPLEIVDVGGGLAVDYEGTQSRSDCSANYELADYARVVVRALAEECAETGISPPAIFTESGRALTAHHAILVTDIVRSERRPELSDSPTTDDQDDVVVQDLCQILNNRHAPPPHEVYHEAADLMAVAREKFVHGLIGLDQLAKAERIFNTLCRVLPDSFEANSVALHALAEQLQSKLADKALCNLSVFRSLPDIWALDQVFPIVPVTGNETRDTLRVTLGDLTCDSDGRIDHYVGQTGVSPFLEIPRSSQAPQLLAFFLVGAYQEILGDVHNLFGAPDSISFSFHNGAAAITSIDRGESISTVHRIAGFDSHQLMESISARECSGQTDFLNDVIASLETETGYLKSD